MSQDELIVDFLLKENAGISNGDRWLVVNNIDGIVFTVYSREYGQKYTRTIYDGKDLEAAIMALSGKGSS
jgi:hypothetical protein